MVVLHLRGEGARSANTIGNVGLPRRRLRRHEADRVEGLERVLHRESLLRVEVVVTKPLRFGSEGRLPRFLVRLPRASSCVFLVRLPRASSSRFLSRRRAGRGKKKEWKATILPLDERSVLWFSAPDAEEAPRTDTPPGIPEVLEPRSVL